MRTHLGLGALVVVALFALGGCAAADADQPASSAPTTDPSAEVESSTTAQWASLIAEQQGSWADWKASWDDSQCSSLEAGLESGTICRIQLYTAATIAKTTVIEHEIAVTPGRPNFIADAQPAEIADLFAATNAAAVEAQTTGEAWSAAGCDLEVADDCTALAFTFERAIDGLLSKFDGWSPYM